MVASEDGPGKLIELRRKQFYSRVAVSSPDQCWPWTGCRYPITSENKWDYGKTQIFGYVTTAHRASFLFTGQPVPSGMLVCHKCDNPPCVNPGHLFLGTSLDNLEDCASKGRRVFNPNKGELHYRSELTDSDVLQIRSMRASGMKLKDIGQEFGIPFKHVSLISLRKRWKHI